MIKQQIAEKLKARRIELGLTPKQVANALGYKHYRSVHTLERTGNISVRTLFKACEYLEISGRYVTGFTSNCYGSIRFSKLLEIESKKSKKLGGELHKELTDKTGINVSYKTLRDWISKGHLPKIETFIAVCKALDVDVDCLRV